VSNAIKFTPSGGSVTVQLQRLADSAVVTVADAGVGIRPEFLGDIFERFRQQSASTTRRHGGLGLGLSITKQLAVLHGGSVRAWSAGEGQGATFTIELPLGSSKLADTPTASPDGSMASARENGVSL